MQPFTRDVIHIIQNIPPGNVLTYGMVAALAGHPGAARQVARILHSMSEKHDLPWHRVINAAGRISLRPSGGHDIQKHRLESEGVRFDRSGRVDFQECLWDVPAMEDI